VKCNKENAYLAAYAAADASGESFSLPEEFKERICTAILSGKSLKQALQTIAEQVKPSDILYDGGVVVVRLKHPNKYMAGRDAASTSASPAKNP